MKVLFIGDIVGKPGRNSVRSLLPTLKNLYKFDFVIANGENAAGGFGINEKTAKELFDAGVDVITTGNHVWDKKEAVAYISKENRILRPLNYPPKALGYGSIIVSVNDVSKVAVLCVSGRIFMNIFDCPFRTTKAVLQDIYEQTNIIIIDFHAEATSEKYAFGYYFDGLVSAVIGTHTHVQTADEKILPKGTAYITDVGMTGPEDSIIGVEKEQIIEKFLDMMPRKFNVPNTKAVLCAVAIEINDRTGKARSIQRIKMSSQ
ncbi:MAG: TIGR00282 family metallophosphoesterase [Thermodesulfovibrionales bacterium]|nr:TIGR00282 family metallophosphoesterase [Thermodesulfovibrionales bacterium]